MALILVSTVRYLFIIFVIVLILSIFKEIQGISNYMKINKTYNDYKKANPNSTNENDKNHLDIYEKRKESIDFMYYMFAAITVTGAGALYIMKNYSF